MSKCVVENCESTNGISFKTLTEENVKCISNLKLECQPTENNIICSDHIGNSEINGLKNDNLLNELDQQGICSDTKNNTLGEYDLLRKTACRTCATRDSLELSIFEAIHGEIIANMIVSCCHPITITQDDGYPSMICTICLRQLQDAYEFRNKCLNVNEMWHDKQKLPTKRKMEDCENASAKRQHVENILKQNIDFKDNMPSSNIESNIRNINIKNDIQNQTSKIILATEPPPLVPIEKNENCNKRVPDSNYYQIQKQSEKIPAVPITEESRTLFQQKEIKQQVIKYKDSEVVIPNAITIKTQKKFESSTGIHSCILTHGLQESVFVMADGYLFTFGLLKGNNRQLKCVLPNCKAKAEQKLLDKNAHKNENEITVTVPHSHKAPSDQLRKKQMFFHVMRKRMLHDKTLNIRGIYEQVCTQEPEIRQLVPLRNVINEICRHQLSNKLPRITSFEEFYDKIEGEGCEKLHFTNTNKQFYQERFCTEDGSMAVVFGNTDIIEDISQSTLMYVDASFKIDTFENFKYQLVTVLVWMDDSYYPILFALVSKKTHEIFKKVFQYLHDVLAPNLRPHEIVTDYEANLYYSLGEIYLESHIGGSVFYYTQNLYKKICSLNLSRELETNSNFRNLYHMLLMLPLLPVNTISDALKNIELQSKELGLSQLAQPIFDHIHSQWILTVTAEMFCVHRLENRINENVIAPFKKFRDYLLLFKGKVNQTLITIGQVVEKLIELESFLHEVYTKSDKKSFGRDLSSFQKKNVIRAWQYIDAHPKININNFFQKVLGYVKCMENQLWIWGFYRYTGSSDDVLINVSNSLTFIGDSNQTKEADYEDQREEEEEEIEGDQTMTGYVEVEGQQSMLNAEMSDSPTIVMEAVIDNDGGVVLQSNNVLNSTKLEKTFLKYIKYE